MTLLLQSPIRCSDKPAASRLAHLTTRLGDFATNGHE
jgi:hypothetical protein